MPLEGNEPERRLTTFCRLDSIRVRGKIKVVLHALLAAVALEVGSGRVPAYYAAMRAHCLKSFTSSLIRSVMVTLTVERIGTTLLHLKKWLLTPSLASSGGQWSVTLIETQPSS